MTHTSRVLARERSLPAQQMCAEAYAARSGAQDSSTGSTGHEHVPRTEAPRSLLPTPRDRSSTSAPVVSPSSSIPDALRHCRSFHGKNSPNATGQTAIRVVGGDVVGSLQHAPSMDSMSAPASTSPMNFSTTSSIPRPPSRTPKKRRRGGQRDTSTPARRGSIRPLNAQRTKLAEPNPG